VRTEGFVFSSFFCSPLGSVMCLAHETWYFQVTCFQGAFRVYPSPCKFAQLCYRETTPYYVKLAQDILYILLYLCTHVPPPSPSSDTFVSTCIGLLSFY